jgi:hypothetical protein
MKRSLVWLQSISLFLLIFFVFFLQAQAQTKAPEEQAAPPTGTPVANPFDSFKHFTAIMNGGLTSEKDRKLYRSGKMMRSDFSDQYRITDIDAPATWVMFAKDKNCAKFDVADGGDFPFYGLKKFKVTRVASEPGAAEEKETVDGHSCKIDNLTFVNSEANPPVTIEMKLYHAEDLKGFPIKIEAHNLVSKRRFTISYTEVNLETPDPKLFVHPAKCTSGSEKIEMKPGSTPAPSKPAPKTPPSQ